MSFTNSTYYTAGPSPLGRFTQPISIVNPEDLPPPDRLKKDANEVILDSTKLLTIPGMCSIGGSLNYTDTANLKVVEDRNAFGQALFQNINAGGNASMNLAVVNDSLGTDYMVTGINSSAFTPLNNVLFEIPTAGYISNTQDVVIGPQSDHSSTSRTYLTYASGSKAVELNEAGALGWEASYNGTLTQGTFGSAGDVLTSNGNDAPCTWTTPTAPNANNIIYVSNGSGAMTVQTAPTIDMLASTNVTFVKTSTAFLQIYFELYCVVPGYQTYTLLYDGNPVQTFNAGMSQSSFRFAYNYTFTFSAIAGARTIQVTATDANGLITDANDSFQWTLTQLNG
jgi:hypothetical protein